MRLAGRPAAAHLPATEVAAWASRITGPAHEHRGRIRPAAPPLDDLALLVNRAAYGVNEPTEDDAYRARKQALAYVGDLRGRRPWWRRWLWWADPRPLRWR
jgi:hypothetical protein